jgi:TolB protein
VAASARQINMFGELPWQSARTPGTRESVSLKQHTWSEVGADFDPDVDGSGARMVFASTRHSLKPDLYIKSLEGVALTQLTSDPASDVQPTFSPDGQRIAFASDRAGNWDIWVMDLSGGAPMQVTSTPADELHPSWSSDGERIVYCAMSEAGGAWELWISTARNAATRRFVGFGLFPKWSPSGEKILFQRARERGGRLFSIWTVELMDDEPKFPTEIAFSAGQALTLPTWSRDGSQIAYVSVPDPEGVAVGNMTAGATGSGGGLGESTDIWVTQADGRGQKCLTDGFGANYGPVFAPDGRLFFVSSRTGRESIWSLMPVGDGGKEVSEPSRTMHGATIQYQDAVQGDKADERGARGGTRSMMLPDRVGRGRTQAVAEIGR